MRLKDLRLNLGAAIYGNNGGTTDAFTIGDTIDPAHLKFFPLSWNLADSATLCFAQKQMKDASAQLCSAN